MENLTLSKLFNIITKNIRIILLFSVVGLIAGILYSVAVFKPIYKSTAKLLIKDTKQQAFITDLGMSSNLTPLTRDGNPSLTQIQILKSGAFADNVWKEISAQYKFKDDSRVGAQLMQKAITVQNPVGTDIIEITASWSNPDIARDIANKFATAYISSNIDTEKKGILQSQKAINKQLENAQKNLSQIRENIKRFRQANSTVNLDVEAENIVGQISNLENRYHEINASARAEANRVNSMADSLGIDWHKAINSVALGHNPNFTELQTRLGETQEQIAGLSTKYTAAHPSIVALNAKIDQIKSELGDQIKQTVGESFNNEEENLVISDPVRTGMMEELARSEATYRGLLAQSNILRSAVSSLQSRKSSIPNKQLVLSNFMQEEANWTGIVNTLKSKQIEANIRESEIVSNIGMINNPRTPLYPVFPSRSSIVVLFALLGALLGITNVMTLYFTKDTYDEIDEIEQDLNAPILGTIPWLDKETYKETDSILTVDDSSSFYSLAYQKLVSGLKIKGYNSRSKSFAFTSAECSKARSSVLMNIAYGLNNAGQSVIVVDADFRTPSVHDEFKLIANNKFNLSGLLTNITKETSESSEFNWRQLTYYIQKLPEVRNLHILANNGNVSNPCEFLHLPAFNILIQKLKEQYDWVLLDAPPAIAVPDATIIGSYVDGVVLMTGLNPNKSTLKKIHKQFSMYNIPIFGVVTRELQTSEAVSSNEYIKQMISRMIPEAAK
ncbi:MAG: Wzz/FepE/Etk N-terminal domain-containing protein [bacterium]